VPVFFFSFFFFEAWDEVFCFCCCFCFVLVPVFVRAPAEFGFFLMDGICIIDWGESFMACVLTVIGTGPQLREGVMLKSVRYILYLLLRGVQMTAYEYLSNPMLVVFFMSLIACEAMFVMETSISQSTGGLL